MGRGPRTQFTPLPTSQRRPGPARHILALVAWIALFASIAWFAKRGPLNQNVRLFDFADTYSAARAWLAGRSPFDEKDLSRIWLHDGGSKEVGALIADTPTVLPPTTCVVFAPLALFSPSLASGIWMTLSIAMVLSWIAIAVRLSGLWWRDPRTLLLAAWILALGPVHILISSGHPTTLAVTFILLGIVLSRRKSEEDLPGGSHAAATWSGVMFGLAVAIKPQLGLPFVLYVLYCGRARIAIAAAFVIATAWVVAIGRLEIAQVHWIPSWTRALRLGQDGGTLDFTPANPLRTHLLNLQLIVYTYLYDRTFAHVATGVIVAVLLFVCFTLLPPGREPRDRLIGFAIAGGLCLMPVYHRYYDAMILIVPALAWAMAAVTSRDPTLRKCAWVTLILLLPFFLPVGFVQNLILKGYASPEMADFPWWEHLVVPNAALAVLFATIVLLVAMYRVERTRISQ